VYLNNVCNWYRGEDAVTGTIREYVLPSGAFVEIETRGISSPDQTSGSNYSPAGVGEKLSSTISALSSAIPGVAEVIAGITESLASEIASSEEYTLEVGLKVGASGNLIIAGGSAECNFKISLKYKGAQAIKELSPTAAKE
jgi:hypothetical protein